MKTVFHVSPSDDVYHDRVRVIISDNLSQGTSEPCKLLPWMYLGSQLHAESLRLLRRIGVTHVLNCAALECQVDDPYEGLGIKYYQFHAKDNEHYNIVRHFPEAFRFLDLVRQRGGVCLVHCAMGINRSAATCVGYLMTTKNWPLLETVEYVSKRRRVILSNQGFRKQLVAFARKKELLDKIEEEVVIKEPVVEDWAPVCLRKEEQEDRERASRLGSMRDYLYSSSKPPAGRRKKRALPAPRMPLENGCIPTLTFYRTPESSRKNMPLSTSSSSRSKSVDRSWSSRSWSPATRSERSRSSERSLSSTDSDSKPKPDYAVMFLYNKFMNRNS